MGSWWFVFFKRQYPKIHLYYFPFLSLILMSDFTKFVQSITGE